MRAVIYALAVATAVPSGCAFGPPTPAPLPTASVAAPPPVSDGAACPAACIAAHEHCPATIISIGQCEAQCVGAAHDLHNSSRCTAIMFTCDEACAP